MKVYLAAPIVGIDEDKKVEKDCIKTILRKCGVYVYDPAESGNGVPNPWGCSIDEWTRAIFSLDVRAIDGCDWVVCLDYGRGRTAGTAWECGYAFGKDKKILIIEMEKDTHYSVMMRGCSSNYCKLNDFLKTPTEQIIEKVFIERGRIPTDATICD